MKLIDLLVLELPKRGGWKPEWEKACAVDGLVAFLESGIWMPQGCICYRGSDKVTREQYEAALAASQKVEWDGVGLPPVGVDAEVSVDGGRTWCSYNAVKEHNGIRLVEIGNFTEEFQSINWLFRPIRSEADKKREEAIEAIASYALPYKCGADIYDAIAAGKIPGVRIE